MKIKKPVLWIGSSRDDLRAFPGEVRRVMGVALDDAQNGDEHPRAKALRGFGGRSVLEIVDDEDGDTYRAVYTVRFAGAIYVLHAFQKKAKKGIATPQHEIAVIKASGAALTFATHPAAGSRSECQSQSSTKTQYLLVVL